jgi:hypothetical protein
MAILKGGKTRKDCTFTHGFRKGYKSRMGDGAAIPAIPAHSIPPGLDAYLSSIASGIRAALRRKPVRESASN